MLEFLSQYHLTGLAIGICTFLIIGLFHPVVIKCEYYFGTRCWWWFLILGIAGAAASIWVDSLFWSVLLGAFEGVEQQDRGRKGWFPKNPRRRYPF